jgi:ketosteroid isomerase-like protein
MNSHDNLDTVKKLYSALGAGDLQGALAVIDREAEWSIPGSAPWAGDGKGQAYVTRFFQTLGTTANLKVFEPRSFLVDGDRVVVLGYEEGEARETGKQWKTHFTHTFTVATGKITQHREYADTQAISDAFHS